MVATSVAGFVFQGICARAHMTALYLRVKSQFFFVLSSMIPTP